MLLPDTHNFHIAPKRIISLVPSLTELLYYLGLEDETVGITKFCVHPVAWFRSKTRVGGTKTINAGVIKKLQPHLIIANKEENVKEQVEELATTFNVLVTDVNNVTEALQTILRIGQLTGKISKAEVLVAAIEKEFLKMQQQQTPLRTAYLIWSNPYMTVGGDTFISDMMLRCRLHNVFANDKRYPQVTVEQLKEKNCELLLLSSEPYPFKQKHIKELQSQLPGVKIMLADGEMFSWYGSRMLQAPEYLLSVVNGE